LHPTCGRVLADGHDLVHKKEARAVRRQVGVVFQNPEHQLFAPTVFDDVAFGPRNLGTSEQDVEEVVREALSLVGLTFEEVANKSPFELSGGQQRRVAFAGVLAMSPEVLVLDEPVVGLDPRARKEFLALIQSWHDQGRTIVMVSHAMEDLASLCSRIVVLSQGRVYKQGSPEEVFSSEEGMKAVGLGVPAAQHGALALREAGFPLTRTLYDVDSLAHDVAAFYEAVQVGGDNPSGGVSAQAACAKVNSTSGSVSAEAECAEAECAEAECAKAERAKGERAASDNTPGCSHE
jgi:energy-coupling factor transport system ATP-binding protein